ncbi:MAG: hypothetical protein SRB2_03339 [Desulfobacteraceae bacterium Eth-SRB2]|nr:MAG: hypothetical protein SRB2_03339 [Desulfobacteraceae bacterium Eth-SRB2]
MLNRHREKSFLFYLLCVLVLLSCQTKENSGITEKRDEMGIHKIYERGPLTVIFDIDRKEISTADRLNLHIQVLWDEGYEVKLPGFGEKLEQFGIVDDNTTLPELTGNNKTKITRSYVLEPFLSGDYSIPPMKIRCWEKEEKGSDKHEIETAKIVIKVTSLFPDKMEGMRLHDIKSPVELPRSYTLWIGSGIIGAVLAIFGLITFGILRKRRQAEMAYAEQMIPPHELAFKELEQLLSERLIEKGKIKLYYQRISDILRRYIESRFGINAPEQTTEEFLEGLDTQHNFPDNYNELLKNFLTYCDLVKFAEHQPANKDIANTLESCKEFISETKIKN